MTIEYEITRQDYLNFNLIFLESSKTARRTLLIQRFLGPILFMILSYVVSIDSDISFWYWFTVFAIASVGWIIFFPKHTKRTITKRISKMLDEGDNKGLLGRHELSLAEDGIHVVNDYKDSTTKWKAVENISVTEEYILVHVGTIAAHIIPTRAFNSQAEKDQFISIIKERSDLLV